MFSLFFLRLCFEYWFECGYIPFPMSRLSFIFPPGNKGDACIAILAQPLTTYK